MDLNVTQPIQTTVLAVPTWLVALLVSNLAGFVTNIVVVTWWASKVNVLVKNHEEELREKVRPKLHEHGNELTALKIESKFMSEDIRDLRTQLGRHMERKSQEG